MKRRDFLKSLGAIGLTPMLPSVSLAKFGAVTSPFAKDTYNWAAVLVRAHNNCSTAMLQRHLKLDTASANTLQNQLIRNGIISAQPNAYGMRKAVSPLFDDSLMKSQPHAQTSRPQSDEESYASRFVALGGGAMLPMQYGASIAA